jgi:hypothetical protein
MEYEVQHGPSGLRQFTPHLRQVVWPKKLKLEKLRKYDGKENPKTWVTLYEIAVRSATGDEHIMANYFPVVLSDVGHQWLLSFIATCDQPLSKYNLERV